MGLASSQARLLLLTARKSDLEYRAQMISQRKIMLAMQTEGLATDYTKALSNKIIHFVFGTADNETMSEVLNYNGLTAENEEMVGKYIVTDSSGRLVVPSADKLPSGFGKPVAAADGKLYSTYYYDVQQTDPATGKPAVNADGTAKMSTIAGQTMELLTCPEITNSYIFQNALRNGGLYVEKLNKDKQEFEACGWQNNENFQDKLNTEDDNLAQSKYEASSLTLQNQDKMLDLELKQIETQHKAIETEYDSVKKVIDKNIEVSYKIFAQG